MVQRCRETTVVLGLTLLTPREQPQPASLSRTGAQTSSVIREHEQMPVCIGTLLTDH